MPSFFAFSLLILALFCFDFYLKSAAFTACEKEPSFCEKMMKNEEIAGLFAKKRNRYKGGIKSMTLIKAKKQRSKPQAPSNYKLRCTNDFVFKSLMTYDPEIGKRLVKDLTESIRDYVVDKVDLTSTELLTEGFQAKDIRLDICARLTPDRLIDFEMQCGSNKMEIPNRSAYYAATLVNRPDNKGLAYTALTPVDQLFLLDFDFPAKADQPEKAIHVYQLAEILDHDILTNLISVVIIEMKKIIQMNHSYEELSRAEKWCWFLERYDEEHSDSVAARLVEEDEIFKEADRVMKRMSSDPAMRDAAFEHNRRMMDMAQLRYEGKREGLAEGIEQGIEKQRLETAREMLRNHCNDQLIQLCTKISLQQLEQLKKEIVSGFNQTENDSEQSHRTGD